MFAGIFEKPRNQYLSRRSCNWEFWQFDQAGSNKISGKIWHLSNRICGTNNQRKNKPTFKC